MNRKKYTAPEATLICFVPNEATSAWNGNKDNWTTDGFFWKQNGVTIPGNTASVTTYWYDFSTEEINPTT